MLSAQRLSVLHHYFTKFWPLPVTPNSFNAPNRCFVLWSEPLSHEWRFRQVRHQSTVCGERWYRMCYPTDPLHYWLHDHLTNVLPSFRGTRFFSSLLNHFSIAQHYQKIMQGFTGRSHKPLQTRDCVDLLHGRAAAAPQTSSFLSYYMFDQMTLNIANMCEQIFTCVPKQPRILLPRVNKVYNVIWVSTRIGRCWTCVVLFCTLYKIAQAFKHVLKRPRILLTRANNVYNVVWVTIRVDHCWTCVVWFCTLHTISQAFICLYKWLRMLLTLANKVYNVVWVSTRVCHVADVWSFSAHCISFKRLLYVFLNDSGYCEQCEQCSMGDYQGMLLLDICSLILYLVRNFTSIYMFS